MVDGPVEIDAKLEPDPEVSERAQARRYSGAYKLGVLEEYQGLDRAGKGALLRREGLYSSLISQWRPDRDQGAASRLAPKRGRPGADHRDRELVHLRQRTARLESELDRAQRLADIQGKLSALLDGLAAEGATGGSEQP